MAIDKALAVLIALDTRTRRWDILRDTPLCPSCGSVQSSPANGIGFSIWRRCELCDRIWENDH